MSKIFVIETKNTHYAIGVDERGLVRHLYWGKKVPVMDFDIPEIWDTNSNYSDLDNAKLEYTVFGGKMYRNCAFKGAYFDGCRDSVFLFENAEESENSLVITMVDKAYDIRIKLNYIFDKNSDIITRYAQIVNDSSNDFVIDRVMSAEVNLPTEMPYDIQNFNGSWGAEFSIETTTLKTGSVNFESRKGTMGHTNHPIFVASQNANEQQGDVFFGALGYGGNFKVEITRDYRGMTRGIIGINDFDFSWILKAGETFVTPKVYIGYANGFGEMSNMMSHFAVENIMPKGFAKKPLPVLYNSWEATWFDVSVENQLALAKKAKEIGCELFVMDDGWFGDRHDDHQGLGDWFVNKQKFPNGIEELVKGVNELGMDFGLWFEPEMVQRDSDLFRAHPDWIYYYPNRENSELRNQLVLNLTKDEVKEYVFDCMDKMLAQHNIRYIKWDMNRPFSEIGAENLENPQELWYRHTMAVYEVADRLKQKYPYLQIEACSSGGGRAELGALEHFDMVWTSDNTDPLDRLTIQRGYSLLYPIKSMRAWVTDWNDNSRPTSLDFRFLSSMQGSLSIGANLSKYSDEDLEKAKRYIALYKEIRPTVQFGDLHRLADIKADGYNATQYVKDNQAVLFVMKGAGSLFNEQFKEIRLRGLDENAIYSFEIDGKCFEKSGGYLMNVGINQCLWSPLESKIVVFTKLTK